ncbi:MAG TPA: DNA internalization-related competence protein ComEC/Rec2 [Syntrophomonas sp.]|nr:DNA internalization-related competence protein ComEC/Rec2 [Syntrophomonas sp.]
MTKTWPIAFFNLAAGILLAYYELWIIALCLIMLFILAAVLWKDDSCRIMLCALLLLGGFFWGQLRIADIPVDLPVVQGFQCTGRVLDFPVVDGDKTTFVLKTERSSRWEKKIRVVCYFQTEVARGDRVKLRGVLKPPRTPGNPGAFNYVRYLAHNGIYYNFSVKNSNSLQIMAPASGPVSWLDGFRVRAERVFQATLPEQEAGILLGMLLGAQAGIDEEQYEAFQKTGIIHLFSVSGLHVGFLLLLVGWIVSLLGLSKGKRFVCGTVVLLLYGTMIAWPVYVIRSIFMGILGLAAYYFGRKNDMMNALALAGVFNLLLDPAALFTISFQLTFLATWGLIFIFPHLRDVLPWKGWGWDLIWLPLAAELAVMPFIAYYFNILTPVSIITNILVSYLSGVAVVLGFIALFLAPGLPFLATLFLYPAGFFTELILLIVKWMQLVPGGYIWVATPAIFFILLYYAGVITGLYVLGSSWERKWLWPSAAAVLIFLVVLLLPAGFYHRGQLEIDFIDVGQGDAILIKTPQGKFLLLDGGGSMLYDVGDTIVLPYLHRRGIRSLTALLNSHPDHDHLQGLESVAQELTVQTILLPQWLQEAEEYHPLQQIALRKKIDLQMISAGQEINIEEGLRIKALHPGQALSADYNEQSLVMQISYGDFSILLTGDIGKEVMQSLLDKSLITDTTIVKVPHHGSKGSLLPAFYQRLNARYAIISVGPDNQFGHPHPSVLASLEKANLKILRTDQQGAIIIFTDGRRLQIRPTK